MELILSLIVFVFALSLLLPSRGVSGGRPLLVACASIVVAFTAFIGFPRRNVTENNYLPARVDDQRFMTSDTCRSCHPSEYASWHHTFHRTMTQPATPQTVLAPFDDVRLQQQGRTYRFTREGDEYWVDMIDPTWELSQREPGAEVQPVSSAPRLKQRIVMTTGSHHLQVYWVQASHRNGMYLQVPWVYQIEGRRWSPAADSFLKPSSSGALDIEVWNKTCIDCHSVGGQPQMRPDQGTMFSRVGEPGIACESCHGPAEEHVRVNRSPSRRYRLHWSSKPDSTILHPGRVSPRTASQICGQCHSVAGPMAPSVWMLNGKTYRAGQDLDLTRRIVRYTEHPQEEWLLAWLEQDPEALSGRFWSDATIRVAGREYNGLIESACYRRGNLSCLTCHSMHQSDPDDQLKAGMDGDSACYPCHELYRARVPQHTHHAAGSSGSVCYNCHMPFTTYGLYVAMRSHRIDNPSVAISLKTGRPNACNLCHLDKSLAWTAEYLAKWYKIAPISMGDDERNISAAVLWILRGDAAQRAVTAWSLGWMPAQQISGREWMVPILASLLEDPYSAVRLVSWNSLRTFPGSEGLQYDFVGTADHRSQVRQELLNQWNRLKPGISGGAGARVLLDPSGALKQDAVDRLIRMRDDRPVRIIE